MKASEMLAARKAAKKEQAVKKYARNNIGNRWALIWPARWTK